MYFNEQLSKQVNAIFFTFTRQEGGGRFLINFKFIIFCSQQNKVNESKEKLKNLSQSLEHMQACGKGNFRNSLTLCSPVLLDLFKKFILNFCTDCNMNVRDLLIDYNCISKVSDFFWLVLVRLRLSKFLFC